MYRKLAILSLLLISSFIIIANPEVNQDKANKYYKKIREATSPDTLLRYYTILARHYEFVSVDSALKYGKLSIEMSPNASSALLKGKASLIYATILTGISNYSNSLQQFSVAEKIFTELDDKKFLGNTYTNLGVAYNGMGEYTKAIDVYFKALKLFEELNYLEGEVSARFSIISVYFNVGELEVAERNCKELYPKVLKLNNNYKTCFYHHTIGSIYKDTLPDKALYHFNKALDLALITGEFQSLAYVQLNIAEIYLAKYKRNKDERYYNLAKVKFEEAKTTCEKNKVGYYLSACYNSLGELELIKSRYDNCIALSYEAIKLGTELNSKINLLASFSNLYNAYEKQKRYDSALIYSKKYLTLKDELSKNEIKTKMMGEEMNYRVEKNTELNKVRLKAENEKDIAIRNSVIIVLSCIVIIIFLLVSYLYMRYQRGKQKEFSILLIQTQEEERKRISKDLHDGIGQNLLMIKSECGNNTPLVEITIDELRTISRNLHPVQLEKLGLKEALESVVQNAEKSSSIFFSHEIEDINSLLDNNQQINLYRTVQESLSNIIKHSKAKSARITVERQKNQIVTTVYDDGVGFNISEMKKKKSLGLTSMSERVKLMDGTLTIMSGSKGTRVEIKINYA